MRPYDLVVFGASGFTGQYVVREILEVVKSGGKFGDLKWAVAGRNRNKIQETLRAVTFDTGEDLSKVPILQADVQDEESLKKMAEQAEVVVNVVGPYRFFGEPVVKACIEKGASHVDISGEAMFLDRMQLEYNDKARQSGVYVVGACGYDSIPCEMGMAALKQRFGGDLNAVELYMFVESGPEGYTVNSGTWKSAIHELGNQGEYSAIYRKLFPNKLPPLSYKHAARMFLHKDPVLDKWSVLFPGPDLAVVRRTQRHFVEKRAERPVQLVTYLSFESLLVALGTMFFAAIFFLLTKIPFMRTVMSNNPKLFSLGKFSDEGPTKEQIENTRFVQTLIGHGWKDKLLAATDKHVGPPNKRMVLQVEGPDPGYKATSAFLIQSALAILKEKDKLPAEGGVYPPGVAFERTSIVDGLQKRGINFTFK